MSPIKAVETCFRKYATFRGRAPRSEFWWFVLFGKIVDIATWNFSEFAAVPVLADLVLVVPTLAVAARRAQDTGRRGWPIVALIIALQLVELADLVLTDQSGDASTVEMALFPVVVAVLLWVVAVCARRGTVGPNRFGDDPLAVTVPAVNPPAPTAL